jgi:hypothetical protein
VSLSVAFVDKKKKEKKKKKKQTKHHLFCLFVQTVYRNQTKPNLLNNKFNIKCLKSKVPEKLARAAQLLYRSVLVKENTLQCKKIINLRAC